MGTQGEVLKLSQMGDYVKWRGNFKKFIFGLNPELWMFIENCYQRPRDLSKEKPKTVNQMTKSEKEIYENEVRVYSSLQQAIDESILYKFKHLKTSAGVWRAVEKLFFGNDEMQKEKKESLQKEFREFAHIEKETIELMVERFWLLVSEMDLFKIKPENSVCIEKLIDVMSKNFDGLKAVLEETRDVKDLKLGDFISKIQNQASICLQSTKALNDVKESQSCHASTSSGTFSDLTSDNSSSSTTQFVIKGLIKENQFLKDENKQLEKELKDSKTEFQSLDSDYNVLMDTHRAVSKCLDETTDKYESALSDIVVLRKGVDAVTTELSKSKEHDLFLTSKEKDFKNKSESLQRDNKELKIALMNCQTKIRSLVDKLTKLELENVTIKTAVDNIKMKLNSYLFSSYVVDHIYKDGSCMNELNKVMNQVPAPLNQNFSFTPEREQQHDIFANLESAKSSTSENLEAKVFLPDNLDIKMEEIVRSVVDEEEPRYDTSDIADSRCKFDPKDKSVEEMLKAELLKEVALLIEKKLGNVGESSRKSKSVSQIRNHTYQPKFNTSRKSSPTSFTKLTSCSSSPKKMNCKPFVKAQNTVEHEEEFLKQSNSMFQKTQTVTEDSCFGENLAGRWNAKKIPYERIRTDRRTCFCCGQVGHVSYNCPENKRLTGKEHDECDVSEDISPYLQQTSTQNVNFQRKSFFKTEKKLNSTIYKNRADVNDWRRKPDSSDISIPSSGDCKISDKSNDEMKPKFDSSSGSDSKYSFQSDMCQEPNMVFGKFSISSTGNWRLSK